MTSTDALFGLFTMWNSAIVEDYNTFFFFIWRFNRWILACKYIYM